MSFFFSDPTCAHCPLDQAPLAHPKMSAHGVSHPVVYILGEAPGRQEDRLGAPFVGDSGSLLFDTLHEIHTEGGFPGRVREWVRIHNTIHCRPPENATPTAEMTRCCRPRVEKDIAATRPEYLLCLGGSASRWVVGDSEKGITAWRGRWVPLTVGEHTLWSFHTYHPAFLLRGKMDIEFQTWRRDLATFWRRAMSTRTMPTVTPPTDPTQGIECLTDVERIIDACAWARRQPAITVDIETKGLRPTLKGARLLSLALSNGERTVAFPYQHPRWEHAAAIAQPLAEFFRSDTAKIAHNAIFEQEWILHYFPHPITAWHCTQVQAYCLDNRSGVLSLDALIRIYFGFHLKSLSAIDVKHLATTALAPVLRYNALDAKYTHLLYEKQAHVIRRRPVGFQRMTRHAERTSCTAACSQLQGLDVDWDRHAALADAFRRKTVAAEEALLKTAGARAFQQHTGAALNVRSVPQLVTLFKDILHRPEGQVKGKYRTGSGVLSTMDCEEATLVLRYREYEKQQSTYLRALPKQVHADRRIHTSYRVTATSTGRLSSAHPNVQNFPSHRHKEIREVVTAPAGAVLASFDYAQIEARCLAMASRDEAFCTAIWEHYDVHMDWAKRIRARDPRWQAGKDLSVCRQIVKNQWVFPLFYGSTAAAAARGVGIAERDAADLYHEFWGVFKGVKEWQETIMQHYRRYGYVESLHGRRRQGPIEENQVINAPIQASASDIVCAAGNRIREKHGWVFALNIHDDLTYVLPKRHAHRVATILAREMTRVTHDWMNVPLEVELKVGTNWGQQEYVRSYSSTTLHQHRRTT